MGTITRAVPFSYRGTYLRIYKGKVFLYKKMLFQNPLPDLQRNKFVENVQNVKSFFLPLFFSFVLGFFGKVVKDNDFFAEGDLHEAERLHGKEQGEKT